MHHTEMELHLAMTWRIQILTSRIALSWRALAITSDTIVAIKVAGNQGRMDLNLSGAADLKVKGICVFVSGNQSSFSANFGAAVGKLVYYGRGNQSKGIVNVSSAGKVANMYADLAGNQASFSISGEGSKSCPVPSRVRGKDSAVRCE